MGVFTLYKARYMRNWFGSLRKSSEIIEKTLQLHFVNGEMRSGKIVHDLPKV